MWLATGARRGPHTASAGEVGDEVGALSVMSDSACVHRWRIDEPNGVLTGELSLNQELGQASLIPLRSAVASGFVWTRLLQL